MSDSFHFATERLRSNALPSVRKTSFSRKNDPLAGDYVIGDEPNTAVRKSTHCRIVRQPLVDNSSFENARGGLAWDANGFGLLGSPRQQAFFDFVEAVLQERFSRIYQEWLSKFPAGDKEAMLYEVLKHAAFNKEIGKVTVQQIRDLYGETGAKSEIYVERHICLDAAPVASMLLSGFIDYGETACLEASLTEVIRSVSQMPKNSSLQVGSMNVPETTDTEPV